MRLLVYAWRYVVAAFLSTLALGSIVESLAPDH